MQTVKEQVKLITGKQIVTCETCNKEFNITVSKVKKNSQRRMYREYRGTCRHCKTMYSSIKYCVSY